MSIKHLKKLKNINISDKKIIQLPKSGLMFQIQVLTRLQKSLILHNQKNSY